MVESDRTGVFRIGEEEDYELTLVDLPCVVDIHKVHTSPLPHIYIIRR